MIIRIKTMKTLYKAAAGALLSGALLLGCAPETVGPRNDNDTPGLAGAVGDPHPALDTVCQTADTMFLIREDNGSPLVDKCLRKVPPITGPLTIVPCGPADPVMSWGYLELLEGYLGNENFIDCNFTLAPGWYTNRNDWQFSIASAFNFDQNGIPIVGTDWSSLVPSQSQNKWQLRLNANTLPDPCYAVALRVNAIKLTLFGAEFPGSATVLWGKNRQWNVPSSPWASNSPWLLTFCPSRCLDMPPVEEICVNAYSGSTLSTCTTLSANTSGLTGSTFSYTWSTGATTQTITPCPNSTTNYTVTITGVGGRPVAIQSYTLNVTNAACGNGANAGQKVWVCHVPPGNPANVQDICIAPSALPAHVARFRAPGSNPNQGHDSGCEIGKCGSNPCLNN